MKYCIVLLPLLFLSACASPKWVSEDGLRADKNTLTNALKRCDFEKRRQEALTYLDQLNSSSAGIPVAEEQTTQDAPGLDKHTIECMARKGFKPS